MAASSNRTGLSFLKESVWGTTPASALTDVNYTNQSLTFNIENITSNSIRSDRQVSDLIQTGADCSGGFEFELQFGGFDELLVAALFAGDWAGSAGAGIANDSISAGDSASNLEFTLSNTGGAGNTTITLGSSVTHNLVDGQYFRLNGSAADDGFFKITDVTGNALTVTPDITTSEVLEAADSATISGSMIRNGSTMDSFTIERSHLDISQFFTYRGMVPNTLSLDFSANSILTGSFDFVGKNQILAQVSSGTGANTGAATTDFLNAVSNVGEVSLDGQPVASCLLQQVTVELNNNVRGLSSIGQLGFCDVIEGEVGVTGSINMYFKDEAMYSRYLAATSFGLSIRVNDGAGNTYIVSMPTCKFSADEIATGGKNSDVMENASYQAIMHPDGYTIQIDRISAI